MHKGAILSLALLLCSCNRLASRPQQTQQSIRTATTEPAPFQRFLPTGNDPQLALDTQTGMLCRTVPPVYSGDPLGILDPACGVTREYKNLGFVPNGCKGPTWVKDEPTPVKSKYGNVPVCGKMPYRYNPATGKFEENEFDWSKAPIKK